MQVRNVTTIPVVTVGPNVTAAAAACLLAEHRFTALPVVEDGELVGIVAEIDLLQGRVHHDARSPLLAAELAADLPSPTVGDVMAVDVVIATPTTDIADLVEAMRARRVRSVPVVAGGLRRRELVGIVTRRDILAAVARDDDQLAHDVRNRLERYALPGRWHVDVHDGIVTLGDLFDDETDRHIATVLAGSVRGVIGVRCAGAGLTRRELQSNVCGGEMVRAKPSRPAADPRRTRRRDRGRTAPVHTAGTDARLRATTRGVLRRTGRDADLLPRVDRDGQTNLLPRRGRRRSRPTADLRPPPPSLARAARFSTVEEPPAH